MEKKYSIIFLGAFGNVAKKKVYDKLYYDLVEFYRDWGYLVTSLDVSIYNKNIIRNIDWNDFKLRVGWNRDYAFTQYAVVFYILLNDNCNVYSINREYVRYMYTSELGRSLWTDKILDIWIKKWYKANIWLPEAFSEYKNIVMKKVTGLPWILGNIKILIKLCQSNKLNIYEIEKYKNIWDMVCEIPYSNVELIVDGKYEQLKNNIYSRILDALENGSIINACRYYINNDWIGDICDRQEYIQVGAILEKYMKNKL